MFYTKIVLVLALSSVSIGAYASRDVNTEIVRQSVPVFVCTVDEPSSRLHGASVEYRIGGYGLNGILVIEGSEQEILIGTNVSSKGGVTSVRSIVKYPEKSRTIFEYRVEESERFRNSEGRYAVSRYLVGARFHLEGHATDLTECETLADWLLVGVSH